jgi:hypothetical protein
LSPFVLGDKKPDRRFFFLFTSACQFQAWVVYPIGFSPIVNRFLPALVGLNREGIKRIADNPHRARLFLKIFYNGKTAKIPYVYGLIQPALG